MLVRKLAPLFLNRSSCARNLLRPCSTSGETQQKPEPGGFAKAFQKHGSLDSPVAEEESFAKLLRYSNFIDLGDPAGKVVVGTIYHIVNDDLYIDFGGKFPCVCQRPSKNGLDYMKGTKVKLRLKELELSTKFLGMDKDLTLLEADGTLLGLAPKSQTS